MENFELDHLGEGLVWQEATEEEKQKVQEDWKKAAKVRKQIKNNQKKQYKYANFLSLIFSNFFDDKQVLNYLSEILPSLNKKIKGLEIIFNFLLQDCTLSEYLSRLKDANIDLTDKDKDLIIYLISKEKIGKKEFWSNLWDKKQQLIAEVKKELSEIWQN